VSEQDVQFEEIILHVLQFESQGMQFLSVALTTEIFAGHSDKHFPLYKTYELLIHVTQKV
jgi:hypothetical protein